MKSNSQETVPKNRLARINLSTGQIKLDEIPVDLRRLFLGGRGLNMYYLHESLTNTGLIDAFEPSNPLIFGTGILTGTGAPSGSRMNITCISPESKVFADSNMGGFFPSHMRISGFDILIIQGKSPKPIYLLLKDGTIHIRDATSIWGKTTSLTQQKLKEIHGSHVESACIGPAGENRVRFACIINGLKNAAGRGGTGAVMGSKNLKAVVASSGPGITIDYPLEFFKTVNEMNKYLAQSKIINALGTYGTPLLYNVSNLIGAIRTKNSQLNAFSQNLNVEELHPYVEKMVSCSNCVVHCRHRNNIKHGTYNGGEGPEYSTLGLLGANLGIDDPKQVIQLNNQVNDLGLDSSSTGSILAWFYELYEKKIISDELIDYPITFGNYENTERLITDISIRNGFGNIVAEGRHAVKQLDIVSDELIISVKGLPQSDPHDVRYIKSFALGIATATRGADHLRSRPTLDIMTSIPDKVINKLYRAKINRNPASYQTKEHLVYFSENLFALQDCLGICRFVCRGFNSPKLLGYEHFSELISLATGMKLTESELEQIGNKLIDLERWINLKFFDIGFNEDKLPMRYLEEVMSIPEKPTTGEKIEHEKFKTMLNNYYKLRGYLQPDGSLKLNNPFPQIG